MTGKRIGILIGAALGLVWSVALIWGTQRMDLPFIPAPVAVPGALFAPGLVLLVMIAVLALRRVFDTTPATGTEPPRTALDQAVVRSTVEQLALALVLWPFIANSLGGAVVLAMGFSFAAARLLHWLGYHVFPPLRAFGFTATMGPTALAALWSLNAWMG